MPRPWFERYVGLPYVAGGRGRAGLDCWGLVCLVYREQFGIVLPTYDGVKWTRKAEDRKAMLALAEAEVPAWRAIEPGEPLEQGAERIGDVVRFAINGLPFHVGIVLPNHHFLHAMEGGEVCAPRYTDLVFRKRVERFYRHPDRLAS